VSLARRLLVAELGSWRSLLLWVSRRTAGVGTPHPYAGALTMILLLFTAMAAIETVVLHVVLPWDAVRLVCDVVSIWGLLWMLGYFASVRVHPHLVTDDALRVRSGTSVDLVVPWSQVDAVVKQRHPFDSSKRLLVADGVAAVPVLKETNVVVRLTSPLTVRGDDVTEVRLFADDPAALVSACPVAR
jgi:hypothetical protein